MIPICIMAIEDPDDRQFMEDLYWDYSRLMYCEAHKFLSEPADAQDVVHSSVVKLIDKLDDIKTMSLHKRVKYIITTVKNTAINYIRDQKRGTVYSFDELFDPSRPPMEATCDSIMVWMESQQFSEVWNALDEKYRYVLELKYILDFTDKQLARDLGIAPASVRMVLSRARSRLREIMAVKMA